MSEEEQTATSTKEHNTKKSQAEVRNLARLMIAGMTAHAAELARRGVDAAFISGFQTQGDNEARLDTEQESLKASLKTNTGEYDAAFAVVKKTLSEAQ